MGDNIKVSERVLEGLEAVRDSGVVNMFDRSTVCEIADSMGYEETSEWIEDNPKLYATGIFRGFVIKEED